MTAPKPSDLGTRTLSAIVMVAVAGVALWLGGWVFTAFVVAVGLGVIWEWWGLASKIAKTPLGAALWLAAGVSYVGVAMLMLLQLRSVPMHGPFAAAFLIILVIATDVGAYFAGRTIGGPKIAPTISPSKTWAGLFGGMVAVAVVAFIAQISEGSTTTIYAILWSLLASVLAIIAQAGDFFESWMKRRALVKDSGALIPGHGGLFDRVDGLLAVLFVGGILYIILLGPPPLAQILPPQ